MSRHVIGFVLGVWGLAAASVAGEFVHSVDRPAQLSALAARAPLLAVARAGPRVVAVGLRGHIVYSDDNAITWRQAAVPVGTDLMGVSFAGSRLGWAVGHEGVVLNTRDGGATWKKQLTGKQAIEIAVRHYQGRVPATAEETRSLARARAQLAQGLAPSFLDVMFENETSGFVVGAFNTIFRTEDAGMTWVPWSDRMSNPEELHFYAVRGWRGHVFVAGEQGRVWHLKADAKRFVPVPTPYRGTFFGLVVVDPGTVLVFGMRGAAYRSSNEGATWHRVAVASGAGITAGAALSDGRIALVDQGGNTHISLDGGTSFTTIRPDGSTPYYGVAAGSKEGTLILTGAAGAFGVPLP